MNIPFDNPEWHLSDEEREVLSLLVKAWNAYTKLPIQHPMAAKEFCDGVHKCQYIVMARPVVRQEGWIKDEDGKIIS